MEQDNRISDRLPEGGSRIPLCIVSGFLGAGKTTFIKKLVQEVYVREKVVVLENEFGKIDLDSSSLTRERILVESIRGGCICCTSAGQLAVSVRQIIEKHNPDRIIIEPTGLAQLSDVMEALHEPYIEQHCDFGHLLTIVDARNFYSRINISKVFFENQISSSRVIFLSKTENLPESQIASVIESIKSVNPFCEIIFAQWDHLPLPELEAALAFSGHTDAAVSGEEAVQIESVHHGAVVAAKVDDAAPKDDRVHDGSAYAAGMFQNFSLENHEYMMLDKMRSLFDGFEKNEYGDIYRVKGVFQTPLHEWFTCEYVPGETRIFPLGREMPPGEARLRICVIGLGINSGKIRSAFLHRPGF